MRLVAAIALLFALCGIASADKESKARADKLFEDGRKYLEAKEYALACTAFEQSHASDPAIGTQLNIALCYEQWGKTASAYRAYLEAERLAREKKDKRATGARKKVDELATKSPKLVFDLPDNADKSTVLLFDDKELAIDKLADDMLVDPGTHELEVRVPGKPPKTQTIEAIAGERKKIDIELPVAEEKPVEKVLPPNTVVVTQREKGKLYGGIALGVGGAAAIGIATFVALAARQDYANAIDACPMQACTTRAAYDATQDARFTANMMTVVGGAGVAMVGVGIYLIATSGGQRVKSSVTVTPTATSSSIGFAIGGAL